MDIWPPDLWLKPPSVGYASLAVLADSADKLEHRAHQGVLWREGLCRGSFWRWSGVLGLGRHLRVGERYLC